MAAISDSMARWTCICGEVMSNSNHPEIEHKVFSDDEWNSLMDSAIEDPVRDIRWPRYFYWECPNCGRLHFFDKNLDNRIKVYRPE